MKKQLDIILPVYNERETIGKVLREWNIELDKLSISHSFIICEDGSTDGTKEELKKLKKKFSMILNQKVERRGYGGAVIDGIKSSNSKYILCVDSDGQCDPKDFEEFWKIKDDADILIGWRTKRSDNIQRKLFSFAFRSAFNLLFPNSIHDPSAPFVLFKKKKILSRLHYLTYMSEGFWWGFIATCVKFNLSIKELQINHRPRLKGDTQVYLLQKIPSIAGRNFLGLVKLRRA